MIEDQQCSGKKGCREIAVLSLTSRLFGAIQSSRHSGVRYFPAAALQVTAEPSAIFPENNKMQGRLLALPNCPDNTQLGARRVIAQSVALASTARCNASAGALVSLSHAGKVQSARSRIGLPEMQQIILDGIEVFDQLASPQQHNQFGIA